MKKRSDDLQGRLALMVLKTLEVLSPQHGFGIARRVDRISADLPAVNESTIYPLLLTLEREGSIESACSSSENNRRARSYRLAASGREPLQTFARFFRASAGDQL